MHVEVRLAANSKAELMICWTVGFWQVKNEISRTLMKWTALENVESCHSQRLLACNFGARRLMLTLRLSFEPSASRKSRIVIELEIRRISFSCEIQNHSILSWLTWITERYQSHASIMIKPSLPRFSNRYLNHFATTCQSTLLANDQD